jgi:hypothetical protein
MAVLSSPDNLKVVQRKNPSTDFKTWAETGSPFGGHLLFYNNADFYGTSENRFNFYHEETHICSIKTTTPETRSTITINPSPDPNAVFSDSLKNIPVGVNGPGGNNYVFYTSEAWVYLDEQKLPLVVSSFDPDDPKVAYTDSPLIGSFIDSGFEGGTEAIYKCRFVRVALSPAAYGSWAGGVYVQPNGKCTATIKSMFTFNDFRQSYPTDTYLRIMKRASDGKYVDYVPPNALQLGNAVDSEGINTYVVSDLDPDTFYSIYVEDITAYASDSSAVRIYKTAIKESFKTGDLSSIYFWANNGLPNAVRMTTFWTPAPRSSNDDVRFMHESCFAGTLDGFKDAYKIDHKFNVLNGDVYYQDNAARAPDFVRHYKSLLRNENTWNTLVSKGSYFLRDDHEVSDNYNTNIILTQGNVQEFQLTAPETALYNAIFTGNPANAPFNIYRRTNQFPIGIVSNQRILEAFTEHDQIWPTRPANLTYNDSWSVPWGKLEAIFINSSPFLDPNTLAVEYWARRARVQYPGTAQSDITYLNEPPQYIPGPGLAFLKNALLASKNGSTMARAVFFSMDITLTFNGLYEQVRAKFVELARKADPSATLDFINGTFDKLFRSFNYDSPDGYHQQINELMAWIRENNIKNVFFFTGDPHVSHVSYIDRKYNIVSCCCSSIATYRASGYPLMFYGNKKINDVILTVARNSYADVNFSPSQKTLEINFRYGDDLRGSATIPLVPENTHHCPPNHTVTEAFRILYDVS